MGYYVNIVESNCVIKKNNFDAAYNAVCELNRHDNLKCGGQYGENLPVKPADSKSVSNSPHKWFSWMDWNYDETCANLVEVLDMLGFDVYETDDAIEITGYDNKSGQEDIFLEALAPYIENGSYIHWSGEDDYKWSNIFENGKMITREARIVW